MEKKIMRKMKQKFPIGTLVQATIPRVGEKPYVLLGLVISHVNYTGLTDSEDRCEVFFGPNPWMPHKHVVPLQPGSLKSVSRAYTKEVR